ncbi:MAG: glycosyltransferase [Ruminiclostridium sp.]|nr:glycosyltransferase [Ruminiclostridium sp.]
MDDKKLLSFVIPCYRSERTITKVINNITEVVEKDGRYDYEIICVNDASPDNTLGVLNDIADKNEKVVVIDLMKNFGQHSAVMAGFNYVSGDIVIQLDDDDQTPPEEVFKLIDKLNEGYDFVSARYPVKKESPFRLFGSWTAKKMGQILIHTPKNIQLNSYCASTRAVIDEVVKYRNAFPCVQALELRVTRNIADVPVNHRAREVGKSGYSFGKLMALWMNQFTGFSEKPLRLTTFIGLLSASIGFIFGVVVVIRRLLHPEMPMGYSSIMAVMLFMFGIVFLMLGLLGEYVGKMYMCINNSPQFAIRSIKNKKKNANESDDGK